MQRLVWGHLLRAGTPYQTKDVPMGTTIRWLHLTDLHVGMGDQDWLWPRMRSKFREDLQRIRETAGPWDLVLFTGDLVQKGTEYPKLEQIFDDLWGWFTELGCDPGLLAVPGNHDLQWRKATKAAVKVLENWDGDAELRSSFWNDVDNEYVREARTPSPLTTRGGAAPFASPTASVTGSCPVISHAPSRKMVCAWGSSV